MLEEDAAAGPILKFFEDPNGDTFFSSPSYDVPESYNFRSLVAVSNATGLEGERGGAGGAYSFVGCLSHLTLDHASLSRRSTVPTPKGGTFNI